MSAFVLTFATCLTAITQLSPSLWATSIFSNQPIYQDLMNRNKNRKTNSFIFSNKKKDCFACCVFGRKVRLRFPYICTYVNGETGTRYLKNLVCIGDECTCFHIFSFNALTAFLCVAKSWTLSKNQMLVWPSISCYLQLPQPQAAQYFSSFLSALPIFFRILFYFMSYFTCFVYQFIHPNILALFLQPSQYSL